MIVFSKLWTYPFVAAICCLGIDASAQDRARPNVLFIAVDDLNDWVGCLGGHPQAFTPYIDQLAAEGTLFTQAYCAAPLCHPSRTAILTGLRPSNTGIYGNRNWFRDLPDLEEWVTLPQYFRQHGYVAWSGGKIFHQPHGKWSDPQSWDGQYSTSMGTPRPNVADQYSHGMKEEFTNDILARLIDWAPLAIPKEETQDWQTAVGAAEFLSQSQDAPFFLACGIYRPHLSWYAPQEFFDLHPLDEIQLPPYLETDLDDIPARGRVMAGVEFEIVKRHGQWKQAVQGYLAATSFADACVGVVLEALNESRYRDNTIVILWGDHGYHLGQKNHLAKSALWQQATRSPLIIRLPEQLEDLTSANAEDCEQPVSLLDLYPTLIELCGLPSREDLDGRSIAQLVNNPTVDWPHPVVITHSPHWHGVNHAVRLGRYYYIRYRDGGEELYDMHEDPDQWHNLADHTTYSDVKAQLRDCLPIHNEPHFVNGENE